VRISVGRSRKGKGFDIKEKECDLGHGILWKGNNDDV